MKKTTAALALTLAFAAASPFARAQAGANPDAGKEKEAVIATALDYSDGAYSGESARMERAILPDISKMLFVRAPSGGLQVMHSSFSNLVETIRLVPNKLPVEKRKTDAAVLELGDDVALVRVRTARWCDYLVEVRSEGRWRIADVLWTLGLDTPAERKPVPGFDGEKERPAVAAAALDFASGLVTGDMGRLEKALHPETCLGIYMVTPDDRAAVINRLRYTAVRESAKARAAAASAPPAPGAPAAPAAPVESDVRVIDLMDGMAVAVARIPAGTIYLQMQLVDGAWKAANGLIRPEKVEIAMRPPQAPAADSKSK